MWIQILLPVVIDTRGERKNYNAGDWVDVGKQYAMMLVREGKAMFPDETVMNALSFADTTIFADSPLAIQNVMGVQMPVINSPLVMKTKYNIWWSGELGFSKRFCMTGLALLGTWEIAVPLLSYETLALHIGSEADREKTKAVIHDLRVPVYDIRMIFARDCENTRALIDIWRKEEGNQCLAFLRALYQVKPLILALPITWTGQNVM
jgi:hypothetical protein